MSETVTAMDPTTKPRRRPNILIGVTGSVAAIKAPELSVRLVDELDANVKVLLSKGGENFWSKAADYDPIHWHRLVQLTSAAAEAAATHAQTDEDSNEAGNNENKRIQIHTADEEWRDWNHLGDAVLHIDLRNWADLLLLAPLSAHSLAKIATGLCDDTLSCVVRAWDFGYTGCKGKPLVLAPAMNTAMWEHPLTRHQLETICGFGGCAYGTTSVATGGGSPSSNGVTTTTTTTTTDSNNRTTSTCTVVVVEPMSKTLACGEVGVGALASVDTILQVVEQSLNQR